MVYLESTFSIAPPALLKHNHLKTFLLQPHGYLSINKLSINK